MKTILVIIAIAAVIAAATEPGRFTTDAFTMSIPTKTIFQAGSGTIEISHADGKVTLNNITLDEASKQFWNSVSSAFPFHAEAVIAGYRAKQWEREKNLKVDWSVWRHWDSKRNVIEWGLREDGVVMWREVAK